MKNAVKVEELEGYRSPTMQEKEKILRYMKKDIAKESKRFQVIKLVCACTAAVLVMSGLDRNGSAAAGEKGIMFVLAALLILAVFCINGSKKLDKSFLRLLGGGQFQVLDCRAYKAELGVDAVGGAVVYICTADGKCCGQRFLIDYMSAKEWTQQKEIPLLLMRATRGKGTYYELFSEKKLSG